MVSGERDDASVKESNGHARHNGGHARASTSLDPDWSALRATAHKLLDASLDKMEKATEGRCWTPTPDGLKQRLTSPVPTGPLSHEELSTRLQELLPYGSGNTHPRHFGWVQGSGNPGGVLPEMVAAAMNPNCGGRDHAALYIERQVLAWCREIMQFPADSGGLLVSGTSMATILALKTARDSKLGFGPSRKGGLQEACAQSGCRLLVGYAAEGVHTCVSRAFDVLGLGASAMRKVPVHDDFTMDVEALDAMVLADEAEGLTPFVVVGTAGSVNVGSIDDLSAIANLAARRGLWMHIDGAIGAVSILCDEVRASGRLAGMERADSLAFDFHKWLHVNYDCGCVLIRDGDAHKRTFSDRPDYLAPYERGLAANNPWPVDYGLELSRGFRALKVWAHLLEHGTKRLGKAIGANLAHARHLAELVDAAKPLERLAPVSLSVVVFRYVPVANGSKPLSAAALDELNDLIVVELQESGVAAPSTTRINGQLAIRCNITNHRTRFEDLTLLVEAVQRIGSRLAPSTDSVSVN